MISQLEELLLFTMIFGLMIGIGCTLNFSELKIFFKKRKELSIGLLLQYLGMPLIAMVLVSTIETTPLNKFVFILIACMPGGTSSNMFTFLAKGNLVLSIGMTTLTSLLAFVMTPLLVSIFYVSKTNNEYLSVPYKNIAQTLVFSLLPIFVGVLIRKKNQLLALKIENAGRKLGYACMLIMMIIWFPKLLNLFQQKDAGLFLLLGALSFLGMLLSMMVGFFCKFENSDNYALTFETGIQNAPLAFAIVSLSYSQTDDGSVTWLPLVYGALSVGNAILFLTFFKWHTHSCKIKFLPGDNDKTFNS
jgi:predicted Na+-dependent transporter